MPLQRLRDSPGQEAPDQTSEPAPPEEHSQAVSDMSLEGGPSSNLGGSRFLRLTREKGRLLHAVLYCRLTVDIVET